MLNQNPNTFTFNGHSSDEFGIRIERKPDLNRSGRKFASDSVSGRNGNIYQLQNAWDEVIVSYSIYAGGTEKGDAIPAFTDIVEWLNSADDYAVLTDSYDPTHYRMAVFVDSLDIESQWHTIGEATVKFRCKPQRFIVTEPLAPTSGSTITNSTNHIAKPIITLTGAGQCSMYNVTKTTLSDTPIYLQNVFGEIKTKLLNNFFFIDYLHRTTASYLTAITISSGTVGSTTANTGSVTFTQSNANYGLGVMIPVLPNTTYTMSFNTSRYLYHTYVGYVSGNGGYINKVFDYGGQNGTVTNTFTTEYDTAYVIYSIYGTNNVSITASSLMLAMGDSAQTFRPYVSSQTDTFSIGDVTISMKTQGFASAEIDCVRENFLIDGEEKNTSVSVVDSNGNPSEEFLAIPKGNSTVTFNNGITAVSIDPQYWEL